MAATFLGTELQERIYAILTADATLELLLLESGRIRDRMPDKITGSYVIFGEENVDAFRSKTFRGFQGVATIYVFTKNQEKIGYKECKDIMTRVWTLLDNQDLGLTNRSQISFYLESAGVLPEDDNHTYQGVMRFNFIFGGNEDG